MKDRMLRICGPEGISHELLSAYIARTTPPPDPTEPKKKKEKKAFTFKDIWRETQLAEPKMPRKKYTPPYNGPLILKQKGIRIRSDIIERCDQLYRPYIRVTRENRIIFKTQLGTKKINNLKKLEQKTVESIYNQYLKHHMQMELRRRKLEAKRLKAATRSRKCKKENKSQRMERIAKLALPKKVFPPSRLPKRKFMKLEELHFDEMATPVQREIYAPRSLTYINPFALKYQATEVIFKLASQPTRFEGLLPPLICGRPVSRAALRYKITPAIEKLYVIKARTTGALTVSNEDEVWKVSPNALKYKASPRIIELAQPQERD